VRGARVSVRSAAAVCDGCAVRLAASALRCVCPQTLATYCERCSDLFHDTLHVNPGLL
jgi:predicted  nucleic acid-binding Zn-ribbon protein